MTDTRPAEKSEQLVRIGEEAPNFVARSTEGMLELARYRGRWLIFFSHPGDFTPACTSEFIALAKAQPQFDRVECDLLGHSVDSLFSHLAWIRAIRDDLGVAIPFPVIEDPTLEIARAYGMVSAEAHSAATVRAVYFIDPEGIVRAISHYPLNVARSVSEMLRMVTALRETYGSENIAPEGWQPGEALLAPPRFTSADVLSSKRSTEWFFRRLNDE